VMPWSLELRIRSGFSQLVSHCRDPPLPGRALSPKTSKYIKNFVEGQEVFNPRVHSGFGSFGFTIADPVSRLMLIEDILDVRHP
jgi:hypothetical protein